MRNDHQILAGTFIVYIRLRDYGFQYLFEGHLAVKRCKFIYTLIPSVALNIDNAVRSMNEACQISGESYERNLQCMYV